MYLIACGKIGKQIVEEEMKQVIKKDLSVIKCIRICCEMSQSEFCAIFSCSSVYLSEVENNKKNMSIKMLNVGLTNLGMTYEEFQKLERCRERIEKKDIEYLKKFQALLLQVVTVMIRIEKRQMEQLKVMTSSGTVQSLDLDVAAEMIAVPPMDSSSKVFIKLIPEEMRNGVRKLKVKRLCFDNNIDN